MRKLINLLLTVTFLSADVSGQLMQNIYTNPSNNLSIDLFHIIDSPDGGYLLCGDITEVTNQDYHDILVVKTTANGSVQWSKTFGTSFKQEIAYRVVSLPDGYILGGYSSSFNGLPAMMLMKIDLTGNQVWLKGYQVDNDEKIYDMILTSDGNLGFCGYYKHLVPKENLYAYAFVAKANLNGEMLWFRPSCLMSTLPVRSIVEAPDGGLVTALRFYEGIWKVSSSGVHKWYATGGPQYKDENIIKVEKRIEGGFAVYGSYKGDDLKYHMMIQKFDTSGRMTNEKLLPSQYDDKNSIEFHGIQKPDLGYQVLVWRDINGIPNPGYFNTDSAGNITNQYLLKSDHIIPLFISSGTLKKTGSYLVPAFKTLSEVDYAGTSLVKTPVTDFVTLLDYKGVTARYINKTYAKCTATYNLLTTTLTEKSITLNSTALGLIAEKTGTTQGFLYPNPSTGNVSLHLPAGLDNADLIITNALGTEVMSLKNIRIEQEISLKTLEDGVYFYSIIDNSKLLHSSKLVVKK